jgi:hypothetical protein
VNKTKLASGYGNPGRACLIQVADREAQMPRTEIGV